MTLRIIAGQFKNRLIKTPKTTATRPTSALVRKSVFDILQPIIDQAVFLDLFAGSGAMGFEALSRGSSRVTFIERDRQAIRSIKENIEEFEVQNTTELLVMDALLALKRLYKQGFQCDILYIDPPYRVDPMPYLEFLDTHPLLKKEGRIFLEQGMPHSHELTLKNLAHLKEIDQRHFGKTLLHQFVRVD
jgi:16S rRNA (guanine966-N2)-methyltransferase